MRRFAALSLAALASLSAAACTAPGKGALILAISTDMQAPKDIDVVSLYVTTNGVTKFDYLGRVLPDGTVSLPSTLALVEPDDPNAEVRIRLTAFRTQPDGTASARVMRDVVTTIPHERTALLRLPLNFLDDGSVTGTLPANLVPDSNGVPEGETTYGPTTPGPTDPGYLQPACDFDTQRLTSVAGECVNANVDSSKAPDYEDALVFGDGGTATAPACFAVESCFQQATAVPTTTITMASDGSGSCSFAIPAGENGENWNCALQTTDGTGTCVGPNGGPPCLVPLESDPGEGFTVQPGRQVTMVPGVCKKLFPPGGAQGAQLWLDKTSCATKVEAAPVCQPTVFASATDSGTHSGGDAGTATLDASMVSDGSGSLCAAVGAACTSNAQCCNANCVKGACVPLGAWDVGAAPLRYSGTRAMPDAGFDGSTEGGVGPSDGSFAP